MGEKCVTKFVPSIVNTNSHEGLKPQDPFSDEKMSPGLISLSGPVGAVVTSGVNSYINETSLSSFFTFRLLNPGRWTFDWIDTHLGNFSMF